MAASLGADEFLMKPLNRAELARVLQHDRDARAANPEVPSLKG